jgi:hypothetical protein
MAKTNEEFKREVQRILMVGFRETVTIGSDADRWEITDTSSDEATKLEEFFVLTISSQLFRIFVLLHFTVCDKLGKMVAEQLKTGTNEIDRARLYDYLGELGNGICGAIKRDLGRTVHSMGMSTPNRLNRDCMKYIQSLDISTETHVMARHDGDLMFCCSAYLVADEELNYKVNSRSSGSEEVDYGELEFF